jgi:hypothetical protein
MKLAADAHRLVAPAAAVSVGAIIPGTVIYCVMAG